MIALTLGSDKALRGRLLTRASFEHPAKLHLHFLRWLAERYTAPGQTVVDPMYGIGSTGVLALLQVNVAGLEVEARWLRHAHANAARIYEAAGLFAGKITIAQHDARTPWPARGDVVLFSPPYACRFASNPNARVGTLPHRVRAMGAGKMGKRWQEFLANPSPGAAGALRFHYGASEAQIGHLRGAAYWEAMGEVYARAWEALPVGGLMILVIKDHIKDRRRVCVCDETVARVEPLGFRLVDRHARRLDQLSLWQRRRKEAGESVVEEEEALVFAAEARRRAHEVAAEAEALAAWEGANL